MAATALPPVLPLARLKRLYNLVTSAQESGIRMLTNYLLEDDIARPWPMVHPSPPPTKPPMGLPAC
jgi:hypothetical protein